MSCSKKIELSIIVTFFKILKIKKYKHSSFVAHVRIVTFYDIFCIENFALLKYLKKLCFIVFSKILLKHSVMFYFV